MFSVTGTRSLHFVCFLIRIMIKRHKHTFSKNISENTAISMTSPFQIVVAVQCWLVECVCERQHDYSHPVCVRKW